jgi:23S rRNA pseudouridine1911/1915/1917 synthase
MGEIDATIQKLTVDTTDAGERLDRVLAAHLKELSRSRLKALILAGHIAMDGRTIRDPDTRVNAGAEIVVAVPPPEPAIPAPEIPRLRLGRARPTQGRHRQADRPAPARA